MANPEKLARVAKYFKEPVPSKTAPGEYSVNRKGWSILARLHEATARAIKPGVTEEFVQEINNLRQEYGLDIISTSSHHQEHLEQVKASSEYVQRLMIEDFTKTAIVSPAFSVDDKRTFNKMRLAAGLDPLEFES
jgi:hypothetical protein